MGVCSGMGKALTEAVICEFDQICRPGDRCYAHSKPAPQLKSLRRWIAQSIDSKMYLAKDGWTSALDEARTFTNKGHAKNAIKANRYRGTFDIIAVHFSAVEHTAERFVS